MYDILVIGGGVSGFVCAINAKKFYPQKKVAIIEKNAKKLIPCGIPYVFNSFEIEDDFMNLEDKLKKHEVELIVDEMKSIDKNSKFIITSNKKIKFDKLIIATGSTVNIPPIKGIKNAYFIKKDYEYLKNLKEKIKKSSHITIIGGGFIGIETAEEIVASGKKVTLIEVMPKLLYHSFDDDFSTEAYNLLNEKMEIMLNSKVEEIGKDYVIVNSTKIKTDLTIVATGYKPNTGMFRDTFSLNEFGYIIADEYMRVEKDIFAVGDCVEHKEFFTANPTPLMLASTAAFDARVAAANLYKLQILRQSKDSLNIYSTVINNKIFAACGITKRKAIKEGFEIIESKVTVPSTHPPKFPHSTKTTLKLIFSKKDLYLLGAQVIGGINNAEIINILGLAIQKKATASDLYTLQIGTHPILTPPPTFYPICEAASKALS